MTLIAQGNNWWIESFTVTRASIAAGAERVTSHSLERAGVFLGGSATLDHDIAVADIENVQVGMRNTDDSQLVIGSNISELESIVSNGDNNR